MDDINVNYIINYLHSNANESFKGNKLMFLWLGLNL